MQVINLYKYTRADGGTTVSTVKPDCDYTPMYRLIAADGYALSKDGGSASPCVDTEDKEGWSEVQYSDDEISGDEFMEMVEGVL